MRPQGWGKLVNAALLSLINEACVNVKSATLLSSELVGPACVQARSSNPRGRACRPSGKGSGEELNPGSSDRPFRSVRTVSQPTEPPRQVPPHMFYNTKFGRSSSKGVWA